MMNPVHCPYCHSDQVILKATQAHGPQYFEKILENFSPFTMAVLGIKLARSAGIPPLCRWIDWRCCRGRIDLGQSTLLLSPLPRGSTLSMFAMRTKLCRG